MVQKMLLGCVVVFGLSENFMDGWLGWIGWVGGSIHKTVSIGGGDSGRMDVS